MAPTPVVETIYANNGVTIVLPPIQLASPTVVRLAVMFFKNFVGRVKPEWKDDHPYFVTKVNHMLGAVSNLMWMSEERMKADLEGNVQTQGYVADFLDTFTCYETLRQMVLAINTLRDSPQLPEYLHKLVVSASHPCGGGGVVISLMPVKPTTDVLVEQPLVPLKPSPMVIRPGRENWHYRLYFCLMDTARGQNLSDEDQERRIIERWNKTVKLIEGGDAPNDVCTPNCIEPEWEKAKKNTKPFWDMMVELFANRTEVPSAKVVAYLIYTQCMQ